MTVGTTSRNVKCENRVPALGAATIRDGAENVRRSNFKFRLRNIGKCRDGVEASLRQMYVFLRRQYEF